MPIPRASLRTGSVLPGYGHRRRPGYLTSATPTSPAGSAAGPAAGAPGAAPLVGVGAGTTGATGGGASSIATGSPGTPASQLTGLPFTGAPVRPLSETALVLLGVGAVAMRAGRRRRHS